MFKKKKLIRVDVEFTHGDPACPRLTPVSIMILPGQHFKVGWGTDYLKGENGQIVRRWNWRAGYTTIYHYIYDK